MATTRAMAAEQTEQRQRAVNPLDYLDFHALTAEDNRGLNPLVYNHVTPYGSFKVNLDTRLALE